MLELRILSGLHRGATLPLDDDAVVIGSDETAGVVLLDPGIEAEHASLRQTGEGWALAALQGEVRAADTNEPLRSLDLQYGECGRIGRVWVTVVDAEAPWGAPPPDPVDIESGDLQGGNEETATHAPQEEAEQATGAAAAPAASAAQDAGAGGARDGAAPQEKGKRTKAGLILGGAGLVAILGTWGLVHFAGGSSGASPAKPGASAADAQKAAGAAAAKTPGLTPEQLRAAFRKRLADVDLLRRFDLNLRDDAWTMRAALDDEEAARFERTLASFVVQHKITFPVTANVGNAEQMLPFKIRQVISGANASVVTLDGNRLYVGDEYQGVRLVSIRGSRLTFMGKRKIEVRW